MQSLPKSSLNFTFFVGAGSKQLLSIKRGVACKRIRPLKTIRLFYKHHALAALLADLSFLLTYRGCRQPQSATTSAGRLSNMQSLEG